jgi:CheY-specific phosphatase CheX
MTTEPLQRSKHKRFLRIADKMSSNSGLTAVARTGERQMRAQLDEQSVIKANAQFWEQMLAMTMNPLVVAGEFCVSAGHLLGCVTLGGVWKGRIEVRMAEGLAYQATAAMMMQPLESVAEADALDATKEIANMIAGVIKSSLPRPCTMTVPESAVKAEGFCGAAQTEDSLVVAFRHESGDLMVRIWEQECLE